MISLLEQYQEYLDYLDYLKHCDLDIFWMGNNESEAKVRILKKYNHHIPPHQKGKRTMSSEYWDNLFNEIYGEIIKKYEALEAFQ